MITGDTNISLNHMKPPSTEPHSQDTWIQNSDALNGAFPWKPCRFHPASMISIIILPVMLPSRRVEGWMAWLQKWIVYRGWFLCPNVSHHPTRGDVNSNRYLFGWCETNPPKGTSIPTSDLWWSSCDMMRELDKALPAYFWIAAHFRQTQQHIRIEHFFKIQNGKTKKHIQNDTKIWLTMAYYHFLIQDLHSGYYQWLLSPWTSHVSPRAPATPCSALLLWKTWKTVPGRHGGFSHFFTQKSPAMMEFRPHHPWRSEPCPPVPSQCPPAFHFIRRPGQENVLQPR